MSTRYTGFNLVIFCPISITPPTPHNTTHHVVLVQHQQQLVHFQSHSLACNSATHHNLISMYHVSLAHPHHRILEWYKGPDVQELVEFVKTPEGRAAFEGIRRRSEQAFPQYADDHAPVPISHIHIHIHHHNH
jgi:hypothetical protein